MSDQPDTDAPKKPIPRRRVLVAGGAALLIAGVALAPLARSRRRADGLPALTNPDAAQDIGDGFFVLDGWVLTAEDLKALRTAASAGRS